MRIGVTISRGWDDYHAVVDALTDAFSSIPADDDTVVHGASQMDWFIAGVACAYGAQLEAYPPDWDAYGKRAGVIRNGTMVGAGADLWLAFIKGGSRGASNCASLAGQAGIPVRRFERP